MTQVTAAHVRDLRVKTGAGMMDCKKALTEAGGDMESAVDWLRKKGLSAAEKKAGRAAAEGLVAVSIDGSRGAMVEVNSETDFVARNETFQGFATKVAKLTHDVGAEIEKLKSTDYPGAGHKVSDELTNLISKIGENINLRRAATLSVDNGIVAGYIHNQVVPGAGRIGVLVGIESSGDTKQLAVLGKQLAMHVAAAQPRFLTVDEVDAGALDRERAILTEQARASGKPDEIIAKMVEGRLRKFYEEVVLVEQVYVIDGETKVAKAIDAAAKEISAPIALKGFVRFALGEGIERREDDFADEVARLAG